MIVKGMFAAFPPKKIFHCPGEPHLCQANLVKITLNTFTSPPLGQEGDVPRDVWNDRDVAQTPSVGMEARTRWPCSRRFTRKLFLRTVACFCGSVTLCYLTLYDPTHGVDAGGYGECNGQPVQAQFGQTR